MELLSLCAAEAKGAGSLTARLLPLSPLRTGSLTELVQVAVKLLALSCAFLHAARTAMAMMMAGEAAVVCTEPRVVRSKAVAETAWLVMGKDHAHVHVHIHMHVQRMRMSIQECMHACTCACLWECACVCRCRRARWDLVS